MTNRTVNNTPATIKTIVKSNYWSAFSDIALNYFWMQNILHFYQPTLELENGNLPGFVFPEISLI